MAFEVEVPKSPEEQRTYQRRWIALLILSMSLMIIVLDGSIVNIAFPAIRRTFGASYADAEWVNTIYSLVFAALLITWGKLGDQFGRRNIFIAGVLVFAAGSLGVGTGATIGAVVASRALQGLGAAMMSPSTLSIISATFKGRARRRLRYLGRDGGCLGGNRPILGGWFIEYGTSIMAWESWRLAFRSTSRSPSWRSSAASGRSASRDPNARPRIDVVGIILITLSLGLIVFGAIEGQNFGWLEAKKVFTLGSLSYPVLDAGAAIPAGTPSFIPLVFAVGIIMFIVFVFIERWQERRSLEPLFEFGMLRYRSFRYGLLTIAIATLGEFGTFLVLSLYMQIAKGMGAFETGVQLLAAAASMVIAAPLAGVLSGRIGAKWVITTGMILEATALFWLSSIVYRDTPLTSLTPPLIVYGIGFGLSIAQVANLVLSDIPFNKAGVASGATNTVRQIGAALGIAILGAIMFGTFATAATPLVEQSTAFADFGTRVSARTDIADSSRTLGTLIGTFGDTAKGAIIEAIDNNEGFDTGTDPLDMVLANVPPVAKGALRLQGVDLDNADTIAQIRSDLQPDLVILSADIQNALGTGFAEAARAATGAAAIFIVCGALSSMLLPRTRQMQISDGERSAAMAH
ncbi:MAG: MFS transporter [Anaerolineae bacterium]